MQKLVQMSSQGKGGVREGAVWLCVCYGTMRKRVEDSFSIRKIPHTDTRGLLTRADSLGWVTRLQCKEWTIRRKRKGSPMKKIPICQLEGSNYARVHWSFLTQDTEYERVQNFSPWWHEGQGTKNGSSYINSFFHYYQISPYYQAMVNNIAEEGPGV